MGSQTVHVTVVYFSHFYFLSQGFALSLFLHREKQPLSIISWDTAVYHKYKTKYIVILLLSCVFKMRLLLFLGKLGILLNDALRGKLKWSAHPNHIFPLPLVVLSYLLQGILLPTQYMELNGILFAFGSFHSELFSTEDKNSENWPQFSALLSMWNQSLKQCIFMHSLQHLYSFKKYFIN